MFNVRPEALSPWLYVEPPTPDEVPGFRMNPDGSVRDTPRAAPPGSFGSNPGASPSPPMATGFHDAIRVAPSNVYPEAYLTGLSDFVLPPRHPLQDALDQITRIYAPFVPRSSGLFEPQRSGTNTVSPNVGLPLLPYAPRSQSPAPVTSAPPNQSDGALMTVGPWGSSPSTTAFGSSKPISRSSVGSSLSSLPIERSTLINPGSHIEGDRLPTANAPVGSPSGNLPRTDFQLAPSAVPDSPRAPDDQSDPVSWLQVNLPSQPDSDPLLGRTSSEAEPMSLPVPVTGAGNPPAVFGAGTGVGTIPANDVQIAQAPHPQQRTTAAPPNPRRQRSQSPASEQELQVKATQRVNTQLARANTWENVIRQPLPEKFEPWMQKPLPDDWEGTLTKIDPNYLKWTKAAADKYGIPPLLLARLLYKESNYDKNARSPRGARGIAQLMPDAVKAVGLDSSTFDYFDAQKSINAGAALLATYHREFKDWRKAVAAYNMGNTALRNWLAGDANATSPGNRQTQYMLQNVFRGDPQAFEKTP